MIAFENRKKLVSQLADFLLPFRKYINTDEVSKVIIKHFDETDFVEYLEKEIVKCEQIVKLYAQKKNKIHINGNNQLSYVFWISKFKSDYAVHFDIFWKTLVDFLSNFSFYEAFISQSSKSKIKQIVDPNKKYYVNSANSSDLFRMLS